jgi:chromate transporter
MKLIWELFVTFLKIGTFTFGGGLAMLPLFRKAVVDEKGWMTEAEITDCLALSQSIPGMLAVNAAIYIGKKKNGLAGSIVAAAGVVLPAFVSILIILMFLGKIEENHYVQGAFEGIKAASAGLIAIAAYKMGRQLLKGKLECFIAAAAFLIIVIVGISAVWAIVFGGTAGLAAYWIRSRKGRIL